MFTFLKAKGLDVGASFCVEGCVGVARSIIERAQHNGVVLVIAPDVLVIDPTTLFEDDGVGAAAVEQQQAQVVKTNEMPEGLMGGALFD